MTEIIAPRSGTAFTLERGQVLKVIDPEGTQVSDLLAFAADDVREALAQRYLSDDRLAVEEAAFLVGFSEPSAFHRAFKRWTGLTPSAYREQARQGA